MDYDEIVGTLFIDLSKVFDSIDHQLFLQKLQSVGVFGTELACMVPELSVWSSAMCYYW